MKKTFSSREVISVLKQQGYLEVRRNGGDAIFARPDKALHVKVPTGRETIKPGTQSSIEKQTGIKFRNFF